MARIPLDERFWPKVREAEPDDLSPNGWAGCWLWTASLKIHGYGQINAGGSKGRPLLAHRVAYELVVGQTSAQLDHKCRRRHCVNPAHLEPVTNAENAQRGRQAKLTADQVREARALHAAGGISVSEVARRFGVTPQGMTSILRRERWRNV